MKPVDKKTTLDTKGSCVVRKKKILNWIMEDFVIRKKVVFSIE